MRTDAKIGFAIGGVLLAVLTVYAIIVPRHSKKPANNVVSLVKPVPSPAVSSEGGTTASNSGSTPTPPLGEASTADGGSGQTQPPGPVALPSPGTTVLPPNNVAGTTPGTNPGAGTNSGNVADNSQNGFHRLDAPVDHNAGHLVDGGIYVPGTHHDDGMTARREPVKPLPADDNDQPANTHYTVYTVKPGQTLSKIAYEVYGNSRFWVAIQRENKTLDPKHLKPGMKINLPDVSPVQPGAEVVSDVHDVTPPLGMGIHTPTRTPSVAADAHSYTVKNGDTLYAIAKRVLGSGRRAEAIYDLNKSEIGPNKGHLKLGMVLKLPEGAVHTASAN